MTKPNSSIYLLTVKLDKTYKYDQYNQRIKKKLPGNTSKKDDFSKTR